MNFKPQLGYIALGVLFVFVGVLLVFAGRLLLSLIAYNATAQQGDPSPDRPEEMISEKDGAKMRLIPAGEFEMGTAHSEINQLVRDFAHLNQLVRDFPHLGVERSRFDRELPRHTVSLNAFYIDIYEVTNAQYRKFVQATGHPEPKGHEFVDGKWVDGFEPWQEKRFNAPNQPVVCVTWHDAFAYAKWAGKRLPTEAEWEKAARGGLVGKRYPWGDEVPDGTQSNFGDRNTNLDWSNPKANDGYPYTAPVGSFPPNGYGLYDLTGNVWEWCADWYNSRYYRIASTQNPKGPPYGKRRVLRGGSWAGPPLYLRVADRGYTLPTYTNHNIGFRCAVDVTP